MYFQVLFGGLSVQRLSELCIAADGVWCMSLLYSGRWQVDVTLQPSKMFDQVFRDVWLNTEGFGGKQRLLKAVKGRDLYKNGNNKHAKAVLLAVEHQLASGNSIGAGAGGYSRRWEGTLSVEHIMPQVYAAVPFLLNASALENLEGLNMALCLHFRTRIIQRHSYLQACFASGDV